MTDLTPSDPTLPPPSVEPQQSPPARMLGVLFSPGETLRDIAARPDWVVMLLTIIIVSVGTTFLILPNIDFEGPMREQFEQRGMTEQQIDQSIEMVTKFQKVLPWFALITTPLMILLITGLFMLGFKLFGGEGSFLQYFSIILYSWVPQLVSGILTAVIVKARGSVPQTELQGVLFSSPAFLVDAVKQPVPYALLSSLDVFTFWTLALIIAGLMIVSRLSKAQAIGITVAIWLVYVIGKVAMAALNSMGAAA